jgi:predicted HD phosphohydrolase
MDVAQTILDLFAQHGDDAYFGEDVSQLEHALQAAQLAVEASAPDSLIVAALLHDIGHLVHDQGEDAADRGIDTHHEDDGDRWLADFYGKEVTEPIRLHVAAKRYMCAVDADYYSTLSEASVKTVLECTGGGVRGQPVLSRCGSAPKMGRSGESSWTGRSYSGNIRAADASPVASA